LRSALGRFSTFPAESPNGIANAANEFHRKDARTRFLGVERERSVTI
jgi:hypothetical protein